MLKRTRITYGWIVGKSRESRRRNPRRSPVASPWESHPFQHLMVPSSPSDIEGRDRQPPQRCREHNRTGERSRLHGGSACVVVIQVRIAHLEMKLCRGKRCWTVSAERRSVRVIVDKLDKVGMRCQQTERCFGGFAAIQTMECATHRQDMVMQLAKPTG